MKGKNKLNLYLPIILVIAFSLLLLSERFYTNNSDITKENVIKPKESSLQLISNEKWKEYYNTEKIYNEKALILYEGVSEYSNNTKNNIKYVLNSVSVKTHTEDIKTIKNKLNLNEYNTVIICLQDLGKVPFTENELKKYVENGGGILFANEFLVNDGLDKYKDFLGIEEVNKPEFVEGIIFNDNYLIKSSGESFDDDILGYRIPKVKLKENAKIHVSSYDDHNIPIIWDIDYGDGTICVSNSSLLANKNGRGLVMAAYSSLHKVFAYPVINAAVYFIDDFPSPIPAGFDSKVYEEYSCSIKDFYTNIWWPQIHKIALEKGVKFSSFLIDNYDDVVEGPFKQQSFKEDFEYYVNAVIADGGEMGVHGYNHQPLVVGKYDYNDPEINYKSWPSSKLAIEATRKVYEYTKDLAGNSLVCSYVPPSNMLSEEMYLKMQDEIPEIKIFSSVYVGDKAAFEQEFNVLENGTINLPRLYSGMEISNASEFMLLNELSYHYIVSHFIHPDDILDEERRSEEGFAFMTKKYNELIESVNSLKIRNTTVSEAGAALQRCQITSATQTYNDNTLTLEVEGIHDEVYYLLNTNGKEIKKARGCKFDKVDENYYMLTIEQNTVEIEME